MAKQEWNSKNFLVIRMSWREYVAATDSWGFCDLCGQQDFDEKEGYYIPAIDQWYCKVCFDGWLSSATHYPSDREKERERFNKMKIKLQRLGVWHEGL